MASVHPDLQPQPDLTAYSDPDTSLPCSGVDYGAATPCSTTPVNGDDEDTPPPLPERNYCNEDFGLEDVPPPLPERNYSWSDLEDNDDEALGDNSEDEYAVTALGNKPAQLSRKKTHSVSSSKEGAEHRQSPQTLARAGQQTQVEQGTLPQVTVTVVEKEEGMGASASVKRTASSSKSRKEKRLQEKLKRKTDKELEIRLKQEEKKKSKELEALRHGKGQKTKERKRYFGSPLDAVATEDGLPLFVRQCVDITEQDLCIEGLYRISGGRDDVLYLQEQFDEDVNIDLKMLETKVTEFCYVVTSAVKNFFRLLPDPLISNTVADELLKIKDMQPNLQAASTKEILSALPEVNRKTLHYMCSHLHRVSENASKNKMNSSNLAIVFWPTFMRPSLDDLADQRKHLCWQVVMHQMINDPAMV